MRPISAVLALLSLVHPGCGQDMTSEARTGLAYDAVPPSAAMEPVTSPAVDRADFEDQAGAEAGMMGMMMGMMGGGVRAPGGPPQDAPLPDVPAISRKIIYDAQIALEVDDLDPAVERVVELVQLHGGYIAEQDLAGSPGSKRSGRWKLRVPVDRFEAFVGELLTLGELVRNQRTSQDVTEQYYDIEARIRNKRVEEETILKILEERSGKLEDVLKVQVELSRVRGEIEQLQGRLRVLENLSGLATVTLSLRERDDYAPAAPVAPDFATKIARAWSGSLTELRTLGENLVLFVVWLAPWLPLILAALLAAVLSARFLGRRLVRALPRLWALARRPIGPPPATPPPSS